MTADAYPSPKGDADSPGLDDPRVIEALEEYVAAIEAGEPVHRPSFLARHADIASALAECLGGVEALHAPASTPTAAVEWQPEAPLGDFRIVRELGRGGMGVVYEAVQLSLGRRVALKVLSFAAAMDAKLLQRFQNEAHAAAQLHHTNIVPVHAVGSDRGVYFYAMQLIEGQNLASLIEEVRRARPGADPDEAASGMIGAPTGPPLTRPLPASDAAVETRQGVGAQLSTQRSDRPSSFYRTAARLAAQAAEALDYAHGLGIVHRDVKPANLLVDGRGNIWITDFGLAHFHADAGLTQTGALLGTLRYMSPEQAGGQRMLLDHRTDVYSLGATLYELLTLRPIFGGNDRQALLHRILNEEPRPPRLVDRSIPEELETIVLKAVSKAPSDRYATAREFADDLQRFLRHEPIRARRATPAQRARKWLRRHPAVVNAGAVLLVMLALGSLASAWIVRGAYDREQQRAEEAESRFRLARRSADDMFQVAEQELADRPDMQALRKRLLGSALAYYQELLDQRADNPAEQAELGETQTRVKKILEDLAVLEGAGQLRLLEQPAVLNDLNLTSGSRERIEALSSSVAAHRQEAFRDFRRLSPEERQRRFLELARADAAAVAAILSPEQMKRLQQIALQLRGLYTFREADIVADLKLTPEQREQIRTIEADLPFARPDGRRGGGRGGPPDDRGRAHEQMRRSSIEKVMPVLTEEQKKRWQEIVGEPFSGPTPPFLPPSHCEPPEGPPSPLQQPQ